MKEFIFLQRYSNTKFEYLAVLANIYLFKSSQKTKTPLFCDLISLIKKINFFLKNCSISLLENLIFVISKGSKFYNSGSSSHFTVKDLPQ